MMPRYTVYTYNRHHAHLKASCDGVNVVEMEHCAVINSNNAIFFLKYIAISDLIYTI